MFLAAGSFDTIDLLDGTCNMAILWSRTENSDDVLTMPAMLKLRLYTNNIQSTQMEGRWPRQCLEGQQHSWPYAEGTVGA